MNVSHQRTSRASLLVALLATVAVTALPVLPVLPTAPAAAGATAATAPTPTRALRAGAWADGHGIDVTEVVRQGRRVDLTVVPTALGRPVRLTLVLPVGFDRSRRYPVLYLFEGTSGRSSDWVEKGDALDTTRPHDLITVTPDIGFDGNGGGLFTDWVDRTTTLGRSQWETFYIDQLVPWVDQVLPTVDARRGRAVAGLSQGGFGAAVLAARHPDLFASMASFSGAPDIDHDPVARVGATAVFSVIMAALNQVDPDAAFGSRATNNINWQGHDPSTLLPNLRGTDIWLSTGDGRPGEYDDPVTDPGGIPGGTGIESLTNASTEAFHRHLVEEGVPHTWDDYGAGTHSWPYWARDLRKHVGPLMWRFEHPRPRPAQVRYRSVEPTWSVWGWRARFTRDAAQEFTDLSRADAGGFVLTGTGSARITTPGHYRPGRDYRVSMVRDGAPVDSRVVRADDRGRLTLTVPLGDGALDPPGSRSTVTTTVRAAR